MTKEPEYQNGTLVNERRICTKFCGPFLVELGSMVKGKSGTEPSVGEEP